MLIKIPDTKIGEIENEIPDDSNFDTTQEFNS